MDLHLPGADLKIYTHFLEGDAARRYFEIFMREIAWEEKQIFVWSKWHVQPRLVAWYGDLDATYTYSGSENHPLPWTPALSELRGLVEGVAGARFNSVLLNLYRNGHDRMGWHSDNEPELGPKPTIASVSLGEQRDMLFKRREKGQQRSHKLTLTHGSLLLMSGDTQKNWRHAINSEAAPCAQRINLTFRLILREVDGRRPPASQV